MKIKNILLGCGLLFLMSMFASCENDMQDSTLPTFAGFKMEPGVWHAGESVKITAIQKTTGNLLYRADYSWKVVIGDTEFVHTQKVVYDEDKSNPSFQFTLPEGVTGHAQINFTANYQYSATAPAEIKQNHQQPEQGLVGKINITNSSMLEGLASGSYIQQVFD